MYTFRHVRIPNHEATIAIKKVDNVYKAGVAYCSPKDNYCKATGRSIAIKRLNENPIIVTAADIRNSLYIVDTGLTDYTIASFLNSLTVDSLTTDGIMNIVQSKI